MAGVSIWGGKTDPIPPLVKWLMGGLVLSVLIYNFIFLQVLSNFPTDHISLHLERTGLLVMSVAEADSPLQPGDLIVALNDRPVISGLEVPGAWKAFLLSQPLTGGEYEVVRAGRSLTFWVPWRQLTLWEVLAPLWPLLLIGLVFVGSVILTGRDQSRHPALALLALAFCFEGLNLVNNAWLESGTGLFLITAWFYQLVDLVSYSFTFCTLLYAVVMLSSFFDRRPRGRRWIGPILYGGNLLLVLWGLGSIISGQLLDARQQFYYVLSVVVGIELVLVVVLFLYTYFTTTRPGMRNQIRWLLFGAGVAVAPWLLLFSLPQLLGAVPLVPFKAVVLTTMAAPCSFYFSATRRGLTVIDTLIHHLLFYTGFLALGLLGYELLLELGNLARQMGVAVSEQVVSWLAVMTVILISVPLREYWSKGMERLFYRRWGALRQLLLEMGDRLSTTLKLENLGQLLNEEIPSRLGVSRAMIFLRQEDASLVAIGNDSRYYSGSHPLVKILEKRYLPLVLSLERFPKEPLRGLQEEGWELILPLWNGERLVGVYLLGSLANGDLYSMEELGLVQQLAHQMAVALENVRLYSQIEHYSQSLESLVQDRTAELALANCNLARERDRLNVILQNMADGLMVTNPAGQIVLINPVLEGMLHTGARRLVGQSLNQVPNLSILSSLLMVAYNQPGQVATADFTLGNRVVQASTSALGDRSAIITVLRDVTREKEVDRMKTEFVSTVSHELRTPLTAVLGFAKLISKAVERDLTSRVAMDDDVGQRALNRVKENLGIIVSEGERLTRLINDVLDIAKMEAGRVEWRDGPFDLAETLKRAVNGVQNLASWRGLEIKLDVEGEFSMVADPDRLFQVLTNLLSNAIKFTEQGQVSVQMRRVEPGTEVHGWRAPEESSGGAWLTIQDTGVGIPVEALPRLFQRFQQVGDTLRDKPKGTGLGLAICREIITHYGGTIWAESEVGVGSTFSLILPLAGSAGMAVEVPAELSVEPVVKPTVRTVLVVDDDPMIRQLLNQALTRGGYQVLQASDGMSAIMDARRYRPNLLILDVRMPGLSGLDVMQVLKSDPATAEIPILILSADERQRSLALGAAAHLTKPVGLDALLKTVAEVLGRPVGLGK